MLYLHFFIVSFLLLSTFSAYAERVEESSAAAISAAIESNPALEIVTEKRIPERKTHPTLEERIGRMSPIELMQVLEGAKTRTFSKDALIYSGISDDDLSAWNMALAQTKRVALEDPHCPDFFKESFDTVERSSQTIITLVQKFHERFRPAFRAIKEGEIATTESGKIFDPHNISPEDAEPTIQALKHDIAKLNNIITTLRRTFKEALQQITTAMPIPDSWRNTLFSDEKIVRANSIIPRYQTILKDYKKALSQDDLSAFLSKYRINNEKSAMYFVGKLEKVMFILQTKKAHSPKKAPLLALAQGLHTKLMMRYPDIVSDLAILKIYASSDKPAIILFALAFNLRCVCGAVLKEIMSIYEQLKTAHHFSDDDSLVTINPLFLRLGQTTASPED